MTIDRRSTILGATALGLLAGSRLRASQPGPNRLCNPHASPEARKLYRYLWSQYGKRTLTGQQEQPSPPRAELEYLQHVTGRQPAILGLDYIDPTDQAAVNARAIAWHRSGGIVTLCWHWGAPDIGTGYENAKRDFNLPAALEPGTPQHAVLQRDLAHVADLLSVLRDHQVPVLWRPLHEFSGDWFWWGKHGPAAFKALWVLMHDQFTHVRQLDNLIWVLGWAGQNVDPAWYPGRDRVDVAGADLYVKDHGNLAPMFAEVKAIVGDTLPICLHENGPVPDPTQLGLDSDWLWFMTWHTRWLTDAAMNPPEDLKRYYSAPRYITKERLPGRQTELNR
jgi:hypothetical protein